MTSRISFAALVPLLFLLLCVLLRADHALAAPSAAPPSAPLPAVVDRRAVAHAAFENFVSTIYLLSGSDRFMTGLTAEQKTQFELVGRKIVPHVVRLGHVVPGSDRTSKLLPYRLRFSEKTEDFILKAGEPARTAKFDGDFCFNLGVINNPKLEFGLLDANQILFHEFSHLVETGKDQPVVEQVAAKIREYLRSSVREIEVSPTVRVTTYLPPYLFYDGTIVDFQPEPIVLITKNGVSYEAQLDYARLRSLEHGYRPLRPNEHHSLTRVMVSPSAEMYGDALLLKWSVEGGHFLVDQSRLNYIELFSNVEKVRGQLSFEPYFDNKEVFQFVDLEKLGPDLKLRNFAENALPNGIATGIKWLEPLKIASSVAGRSEITGVVESTLELREIWARADFKSQLLKVPGSIERLTGNIYRIGFSIPTSTFETGTLRVSNITFNSDQLLNLEEPVRVAMVQTKPAVKISATSPELWNGTTWILADTIKDFEFAADDVRMRFKIPGASTTLNHIEIKWLIQEDVFKDGKPAGMRTRTEFEVLSRDRLNQRYVNGVLQVDFRSEKASRPIADTTGREGFVAKDSGYRAFILGQFIDQNLNVAAVPTRLVQSGWRSLFKLNPPKAANLARMCEGIFRPAP